MLRCLVAGMTKKEIAQRLYLSVNTVRTHVQHLLHAGGPAHHSWPWCGGPRASSTSPGIDEGRWTCLADQENIRG